MKFIPILFLLLFSLNAYSETNSGGLTNTKAQDIKHLFELTGSAKIGLQIMDQLLIGMRNSMPDVPDQFWIDFRNEISENDLIDLIVPIYDKYFTQDDIQELLNFYNSPIGKKYLDLLPEITTESMAAGEAWGKRIAEMILQRAKSEGYI